MYMVTSCMLPAVGPDYDDKVPLTEAESAEQLVVNNNTYMYGDGKLTESGLGSEVEALDPSKCPHRIIHVVPFHKHPDTKDDTLVENHGLERLEVSEAPLSSDPLTNKTSLLVEAGDQYDPPADAHTEVHPPPPSPTLADGALLPSLTHTGELGGIFVCTYIMPSVWKGIHTVSATHTI